MAISESARGKTGAVLVVGAGIGGMQASLDLANAGFKVYLVEQGPAIGGAMAQLDKTFPTNDCAMCTMAPRLVDVGRQKDIEVITLADVDGIVGEPGNFTVSLTRRARFIDVEKCTGCGECAEVCPVNVKSEFNLALSDRKAVYRPYPQAYPNAFAIEKDGKKSPCKVACPAKINAQGYVRLISQGKFIEALSLIRERNPFPGICGRVCHHPCETACMRQEIDEPIAIRPLKRFVTDYAIAQGEEAPVVPPRTSEARVAIVGAGPSGLTCALRLAEMGYSTVVIDAADSPGGMMTGCLPDYRIPVDIARYDIDRILSHGIELRLGTRVGQDTTLAQLRDEYGAVYVSIGAQDPAPLPLEGVETQGVLYGVPFLRAAKRSETPEGFGKRVVVIGGGNVGIDCAKTASRMGADEVHLACLETRDLKSPDRMPAHAWEIEEAEEESVILHPCVGPKRVLTENGRVMGLETRVCTAVFDRNGKFSPQYDDDVPSALIKADTIIIAIGQRSDLTGFEDLDHERGRITVDPITFQTSIPNVFAGGDIVSGPASVVEAVQCGNEAAVSIDRFLRGEDLASGRVVDEETIDEVREWLPASPRVDLPKAAADERRKDFREIESGYTEEMAIAEANRCLSCSVCAECLQCVEACKAEAIDHAMTDDHVELNVGAVVLAPGFTLYDTDRKLEFGSAWTPNVISSLQFERILSASGPYEGQVLRPSSGEHAKRIAFIQCVGSREEDHDYCSSVCCMYATKEAIIAMEHEPDMECTIFFMDLRAFGKGFEAYYERAKELGVRYVRCRPSAVSQIEGSDDLRVEYIDEQGHTAFADSDLVVLSAGLEPSAGGRTLSERLGVELDVNHFASTCAFTPVVTSQPGIYVCGTFSEPKDIPETVTEASGAAAQAMALLSESRHSLVTRKEYPPEKDVRGQRPRIGVFICHCGINIGGVVDVPATVEFAQSLPGVAYAEHNLYTCSSDTQDKIKGLIEEHQLNRVIVASCTPRTHEPLFRDTIREAGLNPYLFEMANIRDQCSWVHRNEPAAATEKAKELVKMAVAKSRLLEPLYIRPVPVTSAALVIGGGIAGMSAALNLADQGFAVHLVERESELGGNLRHIRYLLGNEADPQVELETIIKKVRAHPNVNLWLDSTIRRVDGFVGNFVSTIVRGDEEELVEHGVVIVATGAEAYAPTEYLYGSDERVITQRQLEERLADGKLDAKRIVMIQCVGSREEGRMYCSRICCGQAIKNALKIKADHPKSDVFVLYRDVRTYGFKEQYYTEARRQGVRFVRYDPENKPTVGAQGERLRVEAFDPVLQTTLAIDADLVVLAPAIVPRKDAEDVAQMLKVPLTGEGFFLEAHMKLRPVDFSADGVFLAGLAHSPKGINESIAQAQATAARAATILCKDEYTPEAIIASVDEEVCAGCGICVSVCSYDAPEIIKVHGRSVSHVNQALCKGCGACASACPSGAMQQLGFRPRQIAEMVSAALERK
ncbi:MAG TPA: FAD-dependent oxidoreductase [Actinobacteria bacterium]|nr:FAD-dependent oxidoreductase [Actinomycetota bacterium]